MAVEHLVQAVEIAPDGGLDLIVDLGRGSHMRAPGVYRNNVDGRLTDFLGRLGAGAAATRLPDIQIAGETDQDLVAFHVNTTGEQTRTVLDAIRAAHHENSQGVGYSMPLPNPADYISQQESAELRRREQNAADRTKMVGEYREKFIRTGVVAAEVEGNQVVILTDHADNSRDGDRLAEIRATFTDFAATHGAEVTRPAFLSFDSLEPQVQTIRLTLQDEAAARRVLTALNTATGRVLPSISSYQGAGAGEEAAEPGSAGVKNLLEAGGERMDPPAAATGKAPQ